MKTILPLMAFVCVLAIGAQALRCQTEDGPAPEQVQRVIRKCMKRAGLGGHDMDDDRGHGGHGGGRGGHGGKGGKGGGRGGKAGKGGKGGGKFSESESGSEEDESEEESGSDESQSEEQPQNKKHGNRRGNKNTKHKGRYFARFRRHTDFGGDFGGGGGGFGTGGGYQPQQNNTDTDANCIMHCFLTEMKMTNDKQLPDKRKVITVLTKDLRDRELKQFMQEAVNECFQVLDLDRHKEKCEYSKNLISCLAEHGKANCDDWQDSDSLPV